MFEGEKWEQFKAEESLKRQRKIAIWVIVMITLISVILSSVLFVRMRHYETAFETARQNLIWDLQVSLRGFRFATGSIFNDDDMMNWLHEENITFAARTRALWSHHNGNIGETISGHHGFRFVSPYGIMDATWGFPFMRTDVPEVLLTNRFEISDIIQELLDSIDPAMDTYYVLQLVLTARDEINQFFAEHDFEMGHRRNVENIRLRIPHITGEALRFSGDDNLDSLHFIVFHFMPFDNHIWALLAHHDEDFPEDLAYLMNRMSLVANDIFSRDEDDAREIAELIGQELLRLYDNLSPDMDLQTVLDLITNTMREIKEITPLTQ